MKSKFLLGFFILITLSLILFPFVLDGLIKNEILSFSPGDIDSWITFWGSYVGAIIGASVVFFVAIIQTKKQNEQQMLAIKLRGKYELQREMRFFYTTKLMGKIEESIKYMDEMLDHILVINFSMIQIAHALTVKDDYDKEVVMNKIRDIKAECYESIEQSNVFMGNIDRLPCYTGLEDIRLNIIPLVQSLINEYEYIEKHYTKYYIDKDKITDKVELLGIAAEAGNEISETSQELRQTLTNMQYALADMEYKN